MCNQHMEENHVTEEELRQSTGHWMGNFVCSFVSFWSDMVITFFFSEMTLPHHCGKDENQLTGSSQNVQHDHKYGELVHLGPCDVSWGIQPSVTYNLGFNAWTSSDWYHLKERRGSVRTKRQNICVVLLCCFVLFHCPLFRCVIGCTPPVGSYTLQRSS